MRPPQKCFRYCSCLLLSILFNNSDANLNSRSHVSICGRELRSTSELLSSIESTKQEHEQKLYWNTVFFEAITGLNGCPLEKRPFGSNPEGKRDAIDIEAIRALWVLGVNNINDTYNLSVPHCLALLLFWTKPALAVGPSDAATRQSWQLVYKGISAKGLSLLINPGS